MLGKTLEDAMAQSCPSVVSEGGSCALAYRAEKITLITKIFGKEQSDAVVMGLAVTREGPPSRFQCRASTQVNMQEEI